VTLSDLSTNQRKPRSVSESVERSFCAGTIFKKFVYRAFTPRHPPMAFRRLGARTATKIDWALGIFSPLYCIVQIDMTSCMPMTISLA